MTTENPAPMSSYVYVLGCLAGARHLTYVGWTSDIARRLQQHNAGTGARSTRGRAWVLLHSGDLRQQARGDEPRVALEARPRLPQAIGAGAARRNER